MIYVAHIANLLLPSADWTSAYNTVQEPNALYSKAGTKPAYPTNDLLYKGLLEDLFEDFLRFMIPDAESRFDLKRGFDFLNQELDQLFPPDAGEHTTKVVDKLAKVYTKAGTEEWILIHLEIQDRYGADFGERMFNYYHRILYKYKKPIAAFAILTEPSKKTRDNTFQLSYLNTSITYTFNVFKIAEQDEIELEASDNPFAKVVLIAKAKLKGERINKKQRDAFYMEVKKDMAKKLYGQQIPKSKIIALLNFLHHHISFEEQENNKIFEQEFIKIAGGNKTMGIRELLIDWAKNEGRLEGVLEGELRGELKKQSEIAREMIRDKFPIETIVKLTKLSVKEIEKL